MAALHELEADWLAAQDGDTLGPLMERTAGAGLAPDSAEGACGARRGGRFAASTWQRRLAAPQTRSAW